MVLECVNCLVKIDVEPMVNRFFICPQKHVLCNECVIKRDHQCPLCGDMELSEVLSKLNDLNQNADQVAVEKVCKSPEKKSNIRPSPRQSISKKMLGKSKLTPRFRHIVSVRPEKPKPNGKIAEIKERVVAVTDLRANNKISNQQQVISEMPKNDSSKKLEETQNSFVNNGSVQNESNSLEQSDVKQDLPEKLCKLEEELMKEAFIRPEQWQHIQNIIREEVNNYASDIFNPNNSYETLKKRFGFDKINKLKENQKIAQETMSSSLSKAVSEPSLKACRIHEPRPHEEIQIMAATHFPNPVGPLLEKTKDVYVQQQMRLFEAYRECSTPLNVNEPHLEPQKWRGHVPTAPELEETDSEAVPKKQKIQGKAKQESKSETVKSSALRHSVIEVMYERKSKHLEVESETDDEELQGENDLMDDEHQIEGRTRKLPKMFRALYNPKGQLVCPIHAMPHCQCEFATLGCRPMAQPTICLANKKYYGLVSPPILRMQEMTLSYKPICCPDAFCHRSFLQTDFAKHYIQEHRKQGVFEIRLEQRLDFLVNPCPENCEYCRSQLLILISDRIREFGRTKYNNSMPLLVVTAKLKLTHLFGYQVDENSELAEKDEDYLLIWLAGVVTPELKTSYTLTTWYYKETRPLCHISQTLNVLDIRKRQAPLSIYHNGNGLLLSPEDLYLLTNAHKQFIQCQVQIHDK